MEKRRGGVTVVELLVVTGVLAALAALLLPAVQAAREAARRGRCLANLRQIGVALEYYHDSFGMFPSALYASKTAPNGAPESTKHFSAFSHLLPYLESPGVFEEINFDVPLFTPAPDEAVAGSRAAERRLPAFICPSDAGYERTAGPTNYRIDLGLGPFNFAHGSEQRKGAGPFAVQQWTAHRDLTDGTENTVGVSEKLLGDRSPIAFSRQRDFWFSGADAFGLPSADRMTSACASLVAANPAHYSDAGDSWLLAGWENTFYNHAVTPNSPTPDCSAEGPGLATYTNGGVFAARSLHPHGVNCLMMSGSARTIGDSIDLQVWRAIGTRAGGETICAD